MSTRAPRLVFAGAELRHADGNALDQLPARVDGVHQPLHRPLVAHARGGEAQLQALAVRRRCQGGRSCTLARQAGEATGTHPRRRKPRRSNGSQARSHQWQCHGAGRHRPSLRPLASRAGPPPLWRQKALLVNRDASRSLVSAAAGDSAGRAARARSARLGWPGSAARPRAHTRAASATHTRARSSAGRGRSGCIPALPAGTAHTRTSDRGDPRHPRPRQPASKPPLRAPKRLRSRQCSSVGRDPSVGAILRAHCAQHGGARRFEQLSGRLGRRARSDPRRRHRSTAPPAAPARPPRRRLPAAPTWRRLPAPGAHRVRVAPLSTPPPQACPRRRSVGACDEPADRRGGQAVFAAPASPAPVQCNPIHRRPAAFALHQPQFAGSVLVSRDGSVLMSAKGHDEASAPRIRDSQAHTIFATKNSPNRACHLAPIAPRFS